MSYLWIAISALAAAGAVAIPAVSELVKDNAVLTLILTSVGTILAALAKSPLGKKPEA